MPGTYLERRWRRACPAAVSGWTVPPIVIAAATKRLPQFRFEVSDIATWMRWPLDLILANAVLQWVPNQRAAVSSLVKNLRCSGNLAVQMPDNLDEPAPPAARNRGGRLSANKLKGGAHHALRLRLVLRAAQAAVRGSTVWRTVYYHPLAGGADAVVEWFKGSALRPFLAELDDSEEGAFLERYRNAVAQAYPALADGTVLLPFPRLFIVATR